MIRERNRELGLLIGVLGVILLLSLRFWASPLTRNMTGENPIGVVEFVLIPVFFVVVGIGIGLFLWEPDPG